MSANFNDTETAFKYRTNDELKRAHFLFSFMASPPLTQVATKGINLAMSLHLPIKWVLKNTIFKQFCGGETLPEAAASAAEIGKYNVDTILDYGVEGKELEGEFDRSVPEYIKAVKYAATQQHTPFISLKITGFARFELMRKISAAEELDTYEEAEWKRATKRIEDICRAAAENNIRVSIDAEETWIHKPCNDLTDHMMELFNIGKVIVFNTFQMYCTYSLPFIKQSYERAVGKGYLLGAKLVRGAYMEKERERAREMGYPDPIQPDKKSTDRDYDDGIQFCLQHIDQVVLFIGTHNEQSCQYATDLMKSYGIANNDDRVIFSQLYGMSDHITFNLASSGYHVAKYMPYGPIKDVVPYLTRRAQENTSVAGQTNRELTLIKAEMKRRKL